MSGEGYRSSGAGLGQGNGSQDRQDRGGEQGSRPPAAGSSGEAFPAPAEPVPPPDARAEEELYPLLKREVDLLGRALGEAIRRLSGDRLFELEEDIRARTKHLRQHPGDDAARQALRAEIGGLSVAAAEGLIRAFSTYFHLVNLAEERHRVRVNRRREQASTPDRPRPESLLALVTQLQAQGLGFDDVVRLLASARLELTFTAHPTETRRRTLRHHLLQLNHALDRLERGEGHLDEVVARVTLLWTTRELRPAPPRVEDEVRGGLYYLPTTLWEAVPRLMEALEGAVAARYGRRPVLPPPLAFRSWIGGDRDGNPFVTPEVTAWAQAYARAEIARKYAGGLAALTRDLSVAEERATLPPLPSVPEDAVAPLPPAAAGRFPGEPYRRFAYRLQRHWAARTVPEEVWSETPARGAAAAEATTMPPRPTASGEAVPGRPAVPVDPGDERPSRTAAAAPPPGTAGEPPAGEAPAAAGSTALDRLLFQIEEGLRDAGLGEAAATLVRPLRWRAQVFGEAMAPLDLREHAEAHGRAVAELLEAGGVMAAGEYLALDAAGREAVLTRELASARPLAPVGFRPRSRELSVALDALRAWQDRGAYIISGCRGPADVLEVFVLAREVGLYRAGHPLPFDVVPLFETLADLEAAPRAMERLLRNPVFGVHARGRGGCEVMIGYSDSSKDAGYLAANWALYRAQEGITAVARAAGVPVSFFHGRGTSTARGGGGTAGRAIASLPPGTVGRRLRLTEQGEALADRYAHPELALRNLEQLLYHFLLAAARDTLAVAQDPMLSPEEPGLPGGAGAAQVPGPGRQGLTAGGPSVPAAWREAMDRAAARSAEAYRRLLVEPGFFEFFEHFTPIREIAALKIASRPVARTGRARRVQDLRAIPWVMAWTQVRLLLPGWYGLAEGLAAVPRDLRQAMFARWPFFRSVLDGAALALAKADLAVAREYLRLVPGPLANRFFPRLEEAMVRTRALLEETFGGPLLAHHPVLARQTALRNPYVDPISYLQVELLARYRASPEGDPERPALERALLLSILGIAAGLRNAG
ncbi:phosphoenolpyruvate carboxylase [Thermaerobacter sp. PB12/4term]|uniref:phosphoenolpyruvate carboxylase n=1 Tax=Thermaerobacter sp. PB12/4term TaxID=2293838 RepID=UPI001FADCD88|nr:phosphoenolpyruvate carboxylase [Thermaerobacter sp. PB12/4term]